MKNIFEGYFRYLIVFMLMLTLNVRAETTETSDQPFVRLPGHVLDMVIAKSAFLGNVDENQQIPMTFVLPLRNQKALKKLVKRIHDPADKKYGKYLSTEEFNNRFAPAQEDYDTAISYAKGLGLTVTGTHSNRMLLNVIGPAKSVETGFNLSLRQYQINYGRKFYAPNNDPEVPASIASIIKGVVGLDDLAVWHTYNRRKMESDTINPKALSAYPSGPGGGFSPKDLLIAYNLAGVPASGTGQTIALFELASYQASDINAYTSFFGLPAAKLTNILVDGGSGAGIDPEVTLDIQLALALAPDSQIYVYEGPNSNQGVLDTYNRIATDNLAKQVSTSWGLGEGLVTSQYLEAENSIFMQMAAHGQTIYAAAGDSGAYDNYPTQTLMVDDPASQPYVVSVGGTTLAVNPQTGVYESEKVWNNGFGNGAGGGGVSKYWSIPSWQANIPTVFSKSNRNVPDVALNADPSSGYSIFYNGQWVIYGGTSCAAPLWASFTACVNQTLAANHQPALGFANPKLYAIGASASYAGDFHDILLGNNQYYPAQASYDNSTGWGSFNGMNLFNSLTTQLTPPPPPPPQQLPVLNISMNHRSTFKKGGTGSYQISVSNHGNASTSGLVSVAITLPNSLSYYSYNAPGWVFNKKTLTFTRGSILKPGTSYQAITLNVKVSRTAPSSVNPSATVSGGGSAPQSVSDPTIVK